MNHRFEHHGPLNTVIDLRIDGCGERVARAALALAIDELDRLERIFSAYDEDSELCRWRCGALREPGPELSRVLDLALGWQERSGGLFNPLAGELSEHWRQAERTGAVPGAAVLERAAAAIRRPRYESSDGVPTVVGDCSRLQLNAIAKGYIADLVVHTVMERFEVTGVMVGAGGDIRHRGVEAVPIGIENPLRPYDNEPPLVRVHLANAAIATSGPARRGFRVGAERFSHIIDPRSGQPVTAGVAGVSVVADEAVTADAAATVASVLSPAEAIDWLEGMDNLAGLVVGGSGEVRVSRSWTERFGPLRPG